MVFKTNMHVTKTGYCLL